MRQLPTALITQNIELQREPRIAIKIFNDQGAFWFLSHDDITPGDALSTFGGLVATSASSQKIDPEKGWSTIGGMSIRMQDRGGLLTDRLRAIDVAGDSLNQNKAEVWFGFRDLAFSDYGKLYTFIVDGIESDEIEYSFKLSDRQRLEKRQIFTPRKTKLASIVINGQDEKLEVDTVLDGAGKVRVLDSSVFSLVEHDDGWDKDPSETIGYFAIKGIDEAGNDIQEIFSFTGFDGSDPTILTGVSRSQFGTGAIEAIGTRQDGSTEVTEYVYLDLPVPKMIVALLTGDLYGQPGATIPDHWCALLTAGDIDLASFENIGDDLWALPFGFQGAEKDEAKGFIGRELLRACDLFLKVNQDGELELKRFASVPQNAAPAHVFDESEILSISNLTRDAKHIRNRFLINWEYRSDIDRFVRNNFFVDQTSIDKYNVISDILSLDFKGLRNRSRDIQNSIQSLAEGIRARYSAPAVEPTIRVPMAYGLEIEVGDVVAVDLSQWPDYANTAGLASSFEVQSVSIDLISQTMSLGLFGTSGEPTPINFGEGDDVVDIDHTGWKELSAALTAAGIAYDDTTTPGTLVITGNNGTLVGGDTTAPANRYYYDGNVTVQSGITLKVTKNFVLDAVDIDLSGATIDAQGGADNVGDVGYFGGADLSGESVLCRNLVSPARRYKRGSRTSGEPATAAAQIDSFNIRVDDNGNVIGLPSSLYGTGGTNGADTVVPTQDDSQGGTFPGGTSTGGTGAAGGGGIILMGENLFTNSSSQIITSGDDSTESTPFAEVVGLRDPCNWYGGPGGPGYPGCLIVLLKRKASPLPVLTGRHDGSVGVVTGRHEPTFRPPKDGFEPAITIARYGESIGPYIPPTVRSGWGRDFSAQTRLVKFITSDTQATPTPGVDKIGPADLPAISLAEQINTPPTPKGNVSTVTITATPPADARYSYSIFEYRALGQQAWYPLEYKIPNETTKELPTDGSTYEFSARSVSIAGQASTSRVIEQITLSVVSEEPEETNTDADAIQVAQIRRLELVNAISDDEDTQWKGPDAEFRWAKLRFGETNVEADPKQDMHLDGYRVQVFRTSDGKLLRELTVQDTFYVYTLADNRRDNTDAAGNPTPVRSIRVKVSAVSATGKTSKAAEISVSNPAPLAPGNVVVNPGFISLGVTFDLPSDVDFVGVNLYLLEAASGDPFELATPLQISGNSHLFENLPVNQPLRLGLESVDRFGVGGRSAIFAVSTREIESTALGDISSPITIDEAGGRFITNNSGYIGVWGVTLRPEITATPLIMHDWDSIAEESTYWFDIAGNFSLGRGGIVYDVVADKTTFSGDIAASDITGSTVTGSLIRTAETGQRMVLNESTNEAEFYGDRGDGTTEKLATIGITPGSGTGDGLVPDNVILNIGGDNVDQSALVIEVASGAYAIQSFGINYFSSIKVGSGAEINDITIPSKGVTANGTSLLVGYCAQYRRAPLTGAIGYHHILFTPGQYTNRPPDTINIGGDDYNAFPQNGTMYIDSEGRPHFRINGVWYTPNMTASSAPVLASTAPPDPTPR